MRIMTTIPAAKFCATGFGAALTGAAVYLNAQHVAHGDGWESPLVAAGVLVTVAAAATPAFAERALRAGEWLKGAGLWLFFALAIGFSLTASIATNSGFRDAQAGKVEDSNQRAQLAREAYAAAAKAADEECATGRGNRCRAAEDRRDKARDRLMAEAAVKPVDSGAERIAAVLGVAPETVRLYAPLLLPFALELGGIVLLAFGFAPGRTAQAAAPRVTVVEAEPVTLQAETVPAAPEPVQSRISAPAPMIGYDGTPVTLPKRPARAKKKATVH